MRDNEEFVFDGYTETVCRAGHFITSRLNLYVLIGNFDVLDGVFNNTTTAISGEREPQTALIT